MAILWGDYVSEPIYGVCCMTICPANCKRWLSLVLEPFIKTSQLLNLPKLSHLPLVTVTIGQADSSSSMYACWVGFVQKIGKHSTRFSRLFFLLKCWWCWSQTSLVRKNFMLRRVPTMISWTVENWKSTKSIFWLQALL